MDASNLLKPALARGELHCVGATTLDEYRKHVEKDAALARRFQPVFVGEPSVEDTISILRGLKEKYEVHHGIRISDAAIVAAATLSNRYITDRFLPDKAIDLMDEAAARLRMAVESKPEELDEIDRRLMQIRIEAEALKKEKDDASKDRLKRREVEIKELQAKSDEISAAWKAEKGRLAGATNAKERLDKARAEMADAERRSDWARAGEIKYGEIPALEKLIAESEGKADTDEDAKAPLVKEEVDAEAIAAVVSRWTGIPVDKMLEGEREKLLAHGRRPAQARGRPGRGAGDRRQRGAPRARRPAGPEPPDRQLHLRRPHRRRQDRADQGARRIPVRRRDTPSCASTCRNTWRSTRSAA